MSATPRTNVVGLTAKDLAAHAAKLCEQAAVRPSSKRPSMALVTAHRSAPKKLPRGRHCPTFGTSQCFHRQDTRGAGAGDGRRRSRKPCSNASSSRRRTKAIRCSIHIADRRRHWPWRRNSDADGSASIRAMRLAGLQGRVSAWIPSRFRSAFLQRDPFSLATHMTANARKCAKRGA